MFVSFSSRSLPALAEDADILIQNLRPGVVAHVLLRQLLDRADLGVAGVVHDDVEAAEVFLGPLDALEDGGLVGDVQLHAHAADFGAGWGSPIVAAADGQIVGASWAGGYGRQVRIVHDGGLMTTYSHMSAMVAQPGMPVKQGQVIGYVGSTGLSTGPHLHFETLRNGEAVNPLGIRFTSAAPVDPGQSAAIKARLKELLGG